MAVLSDILSQGVPVPAHRPWPRVMVSARLWKLAAQGLADGHWSLLDLSAEAAAVHMTLFEERTTSVAVISLDCPKGRFPSVGSVHAPAIRLERTIQDLFGLIADGAVDTRPWMDHGVWGVRHPLGEVTEPAGESAGYAFLAAEGESLHRIPVGPVHAGIIEPGHFRFTANGETVVRLEERLGYVHRGIEGLMRGADIGRAARLAGRVSGDSTVCYALAFARAAEVAVDVDVPARAHWLRALMAEMERLANHLGDIGAICNDAAFAFMHAHCGVLRERVLRAADTCFGHRLMRDCIVPGGMAVDLDDPGVAVIDALMAEIRRRFPALVKIYDNTASLQDRTVGAGTLDPALAQRFAAGGFVGRASGRLFDARRMIPYAPYGQLRFEVPLLVEGDVNARVWIRIREVEQSLALIDQILAAMPAGDICTGLPAGGGEGMALVEGFRGDVLVSLRLGESGKIERCRMRDPSWFQWPLLEAVIEGNIVADFPLCNKSFNCSYAGHDL
ncbi:nickel-dependent hydrogenase large subunit [Emcibacter sp. SYSU 3D8]|uniref:hydrogenase large subunit n=1 Tax=Emcibacter sp. SYSU 3D8 TaxID=3133969 RepID=UPI0031FEE82C